VRTMPEITEKLDYSKLYASYARLPRATEEACRYDMRFIMVRTKDKPVPSHNHFRRFIKHHLQGEAAEHLFYRIVAYLPEAGETGPANVFADGTKIEACANRYSWVWKKSANKFEARPDVKPEETTARLINGYPEEIPAGTDASECLVITKRSRGATPFQKPARMLPSCA